MNKKTYSFSICGAAMLLVLVLSVAAWGYEKEIEQLSSQMAEKIAGKGKKTVAVVDFTDLQGNVTELGRFLAEELSGSLANGEKGFEVVNRSNLRQLIKEHELFSTGVIDPNAAMKLGEFSGIEALITGTITPFTENIRVSTSVLDIKTAKVIDNEKENIPRTKDIDELLGKEISSEAGKKPPVEPSEPPRPSESGILTEKMKGFEFTLKGCKKTQANIVCNLLATSNDTDKELKFFGSCNNGGTLLYDDKGYSYTSSKVSIGDRYESCEIRRTFVAGIATEVTVTFEGIKQDAAKVALLDIKCYDQEYFNIRFRDIPLLK